MRFSPAVWLALLSSRMGLWGLQRKEPEAGPRLPACWLGAASTNGDQAPSPSLRIQKRTPEMCFHHLRSSCSSALPHLQDSWPGVVFGAQVTLAAAFGGFLEPWTIPPRSSSSQLLGWSLPWTKGPPGWCSAKDRTWLRRPAQGVRGWPSALSPLCTLLDLACWAFRSGRGSQFLTL